MRKAKSSSGDQGRETNDRDEVRQIDSLREIFLASQPQGDFLRKWTWLSAVAWATYCDRQKERWKKRALAAKTVVAANEDGLDRFQAGNKRFPLTDPQPSVPEAGG